MENLILVRDEMSLQDQAILSLLRDDVITYRRTKEKNFPSVLINPVQRLPENKQNSAEIKSPSSESQNDAGPLGSPTTDQALAAKLAAQNNPEDGDFEPIVFTSIDYKDLRARISPFADAWILQPYIRFAQSIVRHKVDVVVITHILLYLTTLVPSAMVLYWHFTYLHAIFHVLICFLFTGPSATMFHHYTHQGGLLRKELWALDQAYGYLIAPLMGNTWNSFYYHHKMHHIEDNGPGDLSSTLRYRRDSVLHFAHYYLRFSLCAWIELPIYYVRKGRYNVAVLGLCWEASTWLVYGILGSFLGWRPTLCVFILPLVVLRLGLMVANWGQHAFLDRNDPTSDYRSSVTLIDVMVCP